MALVSAGELGRRIRTGREKLKLTQGQLAARVGRPQSSISDYERGQVLPPLDVIDRVATELQIPLGRLLTGR